MPTYTLELELYSVLNASTTDFEIWTDGSQLGGGYSITSSGTILIDPAVFYAGALPTSLEFRFDDAAPGSVDQIEVRSVKINDRYVNTGNYLSSSTLNDGGSSTVNIANSDFIFNQSAEPAASTFTTGATRTLTAGDDTVRVYQSATQEIFDALAGRDIIFLGSGDDRVAGGAGDDYIRAGAGNDIISGGNDDDLIYGQDGDDELYGGNGNDRLHGGNDNDEIHGGAGNDRLNGNNGDDTITGGTGNDTLGGGNGNDDLFGDDGTDTLIGGAGTDTLDGGAGNDLLYGGGDDDIMHGGDDDDTLVGDAGNDELHGDDGDDVLNGRADNDTLFGGTGDDLLTGEDGTDTLHGGDDDDVLIGGAGADTLNGDDGNDILHGHGLTATEIRTILNANPGVVYNSYTNSFYQYVSTTANYTTALGNAQAATINGVAGHLVTISNATENTYVASLIGGTTWMSGTDDVSNTNWVWNGGAEDGVQFSSGATAVNNMYENWAGGQPQNNAEHNSVLYTNGTWHDWPDTSSHRYVIEWDAGLINDDSAIDTLDGGDGNDTLYGYGGNDILNGDGGNDLIFGGDDDDVIDGGTGDDALFGQDGDDTITTASGTNTIYGGLGDDTITGGTGNDTIYAFDGTVHTQGDSLNAVNEIIYNENFSVGTGAFTYSDGGFGGTDGANVNVTGNRITTDGDITASGALRILVDGQNNNTFTNGSGSWDASYTATSNLTNVQITFSYRHIHAAQNDTGEDSQVWFEFDGVTYNQSGASSFISEAYGADGATDTGWIRVTIDLPDLTNGNTYNLSMGILHLGSSRSNEDAEVRFDDIVMTAGTAYGSADTTAADADSGSTNIINGGGGNDTIYGSAGINTLNGDAGNDTIYSGTVADEIILSDTFDASAAPYTYVEGTGVFGGNSASNAYVSGAYDAVDGSDNAGSVAITLGGIDNNNINDMSGAWQRTFTLTEAKNDLVLTFDYHLYDSETASTDPFDNGEDIQLYADINGTTYSNDANPYFFELLGADSYDAYDSGWVTISLNVGSLGAGTHTLSLGALLTRKTFQPEEYTVAFDDVQLVDTAVLNVNTLNGGDGLDTLYGSSGRDVFMFEAATAYNDLDVIENFGYTLDAIDLSDLLTGYNAATDDINDFVQLTEAGGNTTISVDANGTAGGASFSDVTIVNGVTGMDLDVMEIDGTLIV